MFCKKRSLVFLMFGFFLGLSVVDRSWAQQICFYSAINYSVGTSPRSVALADFNKDGWLDMVVANTFSNNVSVLLNNGNGTFAAPVNYAVGTYPMSVAVADFNGDGCPDLVVANSSSGNVSVLLGNRSGTVCLGTFQAANPRDIAVGTGPFSVITGDFNIDKNLDVATANHFSQNVSVLLGNGNGTFQAARNTSTMNFSDALATEDFNADKIPDLAVANTGPNSDVSIARKW